MRELIRHILKEQSSKIKLLKVIEDEDIFGAAELVGGMDNLKRIFKDDPKITNIIDSLKGKLDLIYHSRKEYIEFPVRFEIVGKGVNIPKTNSWAIVNLIYDDSNLSESQKKLLEQFVYDTIGDLNIMDVDINPEAKKMFRERGDYMDIKYVNGRDWEILDRDIRYDDNDMKNLHREYYIKSYMNESKTSQENEEDPTQKILNFLLRRYKVEEKDLGWEGNPILLKTVIFEVDGERYRISYFQNKKEQIADIVYMLINHEVIQQIDPYGRQLDPYTQKVIRAVKTFINQVMPDKSNITESKIVDKIKSFFGKNEKSPEDRLVNIIVNFINDNYSIDFDSDEDGEVTFYLTDGEGNFIVPPIMTYYPKHKSLHYRWDFAQDIHNWIGDKKLLQLNSQIIGKVFEKLFKKKVDYVYGYSSL
jgi:hypothetical protein